MDFFFFTNGNTKSAYTYVSCVEWKYTIYMYVCIVFSDSPEFLPVLALPIFEKSVATNNLSKIPSPLIFFFLFLHTYTDTKTDHINPAHLCVRVTRII